MVTHVDDQSAFATLLIETTSTAVIAVSGSGAILFCNPAAESMLNIERVRAVGVRFIDCIAKVATESVAAFAEAFDRATNTGTATLEFALDRPAPGRLNTATLRHLSNTGSGQLVVIEISQPPQLMASELSHQEVDNGISKVVRNVTELRQAEAALRKAKEEAEAANRDLEAFSYSVAHDLRAPLRSIEGFSRVILKDYENELPANARHYLNRVHRSALSMAELIDDLLLLARVTRSDLRECIVDLAELARGEIARLREAHPDRNVEFVCGPVQAAGDEGLLRVLMGNLISNAWKFSSKNPQARIEFGATYQNGEQVFYVRDNGAGFQMIYADKLFLPFQRLHRQDEFAGTGIGLATSDRIVRRHGGRIWANARMGEGATFYFTIGR